MGVKSVEITEVSKAQFEKHGYTLMRHIRRGRAEQHIGAILAADLGICDGKTYALIAVEHPEPESKVERKECALVQRKKYGCFCANCGNPSASVGYPCGNADCGCHLTHTITWAEFTKRDC